MPASILVPFLPVIPAVISFMPGLTPDSHTGTNILRDREFCVNFLSSKFYAACKKTVEENEYETDEIFTGGFTAELNE